MAETSTKPALDIRRYAGQVVDSFADNRWNMDTDIARSRAVSEHASRAAERGQATWHNASQVGHAALVTYEARIEEGYPAGRARGEAVRVASGYFNDRGEPRQPYGTLDVKAYAGRTIDAYRDRAALDGTAAAKSSVVYAVSGTAEAHGVNGTRAARVASASISEYERLAAKGAPHELAKAGAIRTMAERYDQHAQDRQRQQGRDRGGMER